MIMALTQVMLKGRHLPCHTSNGLVAPLDRANVDTDAIIPKQFLKSIKRSGFGPNLFDAWRYLDHGRAGQANERPSAESGFRAEPAALPGRHRSCWRARTSAAARSREHAPWALADYGFRARHRAVASPIFSSTTASRTACCPIGAQGAEVDRLFNDVARYPGLPAGHRPGGAGRVLCRRQRALRLRGDAFRKYCLLNGLDDIGLTLRHADQIRAYEEKRKLEQPWLF